jgi:hypothetical protein
MAAHARRAFRLASVQKKKALLYALCPHPKKKNGY